MRGLVTVKLSEYNPVYEELMFLFIKFGEEKWHLEDLEKGNVRFNPANTFIEQEKKTGEKGIGDKQEASMVFPLTKYYFQDPDTDEWLPALEASSTTLTPNYLANTPIFCLYIIRGDSLEVINEEEDCYHVKVVISEEDKVLLYEDFPTYEHALLIDATSFVRRFTEKMQEKNMEFANAIVRYDDYSKHNHERFKSYKNKHGIGPLFWKNQDFKQQKEYRFVLDDQITDVSVHDVGDFSDYCSHITREQLFDEGFNFWINKKIPERD